jgi:hypothetical protein
MGWRNPGRKRGARQAREGILRRPVGVNKGKRRGSEEYISDLVQYARSEEISERGDERRGRKRRYQVRYIIDRKGAE